MGKNQTVKKTVSWFLVEKNPPMIKFDDDDTYEVASNVMEKSNFDKYPVNKGDTVNVIIDDERVVYLRKVKKSASKKKTSTTSGGGNETIYAVSGNRKVLKTSKDGEWIPISEKVQEKDYEKIGLVSGNEVNLKIENGEVTFVKNSSVASNSVSKKAKSGYGSRDEDAVDRRTALMQAKDVVVTLLDKEIIKDKSKIKTALTDLTEHCYKTIKEL